MKNIRMSRPIPQLNNKVLAENHVFVDTESNWSQLDGETPITRHTLRFGIAKYFRLIGDEFTFIDKIVFYKAYDFWEWLLALKGKKTTWVWAHNIAFDGTLLQLWQKLQDEECNLNHFTDCNLPAFFQCTLKGKSFQFLDSLNIFKSSLRSIGEQLGLPKLEFPSQDGPIEEWLVYCERDVDVLAGIVEKWIAFLVKYELGRMSPTLASQALTAFRTRFMKHQIHIHNDKFALKLERKGYYGGLVEPKFIGEMVHGPIFEYDVNSLYPYVMRNREYPCMLIGTEEWPKDKVVKERMRKYYCIAYAKVSSTVRRYPIRINGRLTFPLGRYWTTLHHCELDEAMARGDIVAIGAMAWYVQKPIFKEYVDFFYGLKAKFGKEGNSVWYYMTKLFLNALYGKFGQKRPQWDKYTPQLLDHIEYKNGMNKGELDVIREFINQQMAGEMRFRHPQDEKQYAARTMLGVAQIAIGEDESIYSFPAIAGAVTAYAREYVRNIQEMIPKRCLFYTDTDSFFVNLKGAHELDRMQMLDEEKLGKLKAKTNSKWMIIHGPKDYETDNEIKCKGIRHPNDPIDDNTYEQEQWPGFKTLFKQKFPNFVDVETIRKVLKRELLTMNVGADGWTYPLHLRIDNYEKP